MLYNTTLNCVLLCLLNEEIRIGIISDNCSLVNCTRSFCTILRLAVWVASSLEKEGTHKGKKKEK